MLDLIGLDIKLMEALGRLGMVSPAVRHNADLQTEIHLSQLFRFPEPVLLVR
jgi:hypothetical protein